MKVTQLSVTPVSCPLDRVVTGSHYVKDRRSTVVVTVETDEGVVGRTYSGDERDGQDELVRLIRDVLAPIVEGRDVFSTEQLWEEMVAESPFAGNKNLFMHALSAIDTALWDTIGKALDIPLYELWGGYRDSVPLIAIGGYYEDGKTIDDLVEEMLEFQEMGLAGVKLKVGGATPERDLKRLDAVQEALDSEFKIACDANQGWTTDEAVKFAEEAKAYGIEWFEEPVRWDNQYKGMREVRRRTGITVCAGQSEIAPSGCRRLMEHDAVDILNFDGSWGGGPTGWRKAAAAADLEGVQMAHHEEPQLSAHLLAAIPNGMYAECFHPDIDPVWYEMVEEGPTLKDGELHLPDEPGFGLTLNDDFIEKYTVE